MTALIAALSVKPKRKKHCHFVTVQEALTPEEREALQNAFTFVLDKSHREYSAQWLSNILTEHGHPISATTIRRHTNGRCCCR